MFKKLYPLFFCLLCISCSKTPALDKTLISYKEKNINQSRFIKSLLHRGFLLYGKDLVLDLKNPEKFRELKQRTLEDELEKLFIQNKAEKENIIIKDQELKTWIEKRTQGLVKAELEYFLNYSNMTMKEWKALFKDQLLKKKVLSQYTTESLTTPVIDNDAKTSEDVKHYQVATLTFDSTIEAQNIYKELKAFPKRLDEFLIQRKGTKTYDWITEKDEVLYAKVKNLRKDGLSKPFESPWGHMIVKFFKSENRAVDQKNSKDPDQSWSSKDYLKELLAFKESQELKINIKGIEGLELK